MLRLRRIISAAPRNVNGGKLLQKEEKLFPIIPLHNPSQWTSARFRHIYELASKTAVEQSRARLKDEMSRSYFQDMKDLGEHGGKVSKANKILVPASSAVKFPTIEVNFPDGSCLKLPLTSEENDVHAFTSDAAKGNSLKLPLISQANDTTNASTSNTAKASLLCLSFRANAGPMIDSWSSPFLKTFAHSSDVRVYLVSFIDSWLLSRKLIRKLLLKYMEKPTSEEKQDALHRQFVYSFGDHYHFRKELQIVNLLTGYIFLVDNQGRIRWQGTGVAVEDELLSLLTCTSILLEEN